MKVYGMECIINERGKVTKLYDENGNYYNIYEDSKYGGYDLVYEMNINTLRNKIYRHKVVLWRNN